MVAVVHPSILVGAGIDCTESFVAHYHITHVINCAFPDDCPSWVPSRFGPKYTCIEAEDGLDVDLFRWYPLFRSTLTKYLQDPTRVRIFIHCQLGINRSMFLTLAYVCELFGYPYDTTVRSIRQQRPQALRNTSFAKQVKTFLTKKKE